LTSVVSTELKEEAMTTIRRFQPTPAFVVAIIALLVSMSGTAVAVTALAPNSVKSKHIVIGQVKAKDLGSDSVRGPKVLDASLTGADVADGSLAGADVTDGSIAGADVTDASLAGADVTDESLTGADVQNGSLTGADVQDDSLTGADVNESTLQGVMASRVRMVVTQGLPTQGGQEFVASCAANEKAIGGGGAWIQAATGTPTQLEAPITASMPNPAIPAADGATGWRAAGRNLSGQDRILRVYAVCVPRTP
jgi:hypothetical protein